MQHRIRCCDQINDNIIAAIEKKGFLINTNANSALIDAYKQKIKDLEEERTKAVRFDNSVFANIGLNTANEDS